MASAFLGGTAAVEGKIPIQFAKNHPLKFSAAGGIATLLIVMTVGQILYASPSPPTNLPSGHEVIFDAESHDKSHFSESGINFANRSIVAWDSGLADLLVSNTEPANPRARFFVQHQTPPFTSASQDLNAHGGIQRLTYSSIDDVQSCPVDGYSWHWTLADPNTVYCVLTRDGAHYVKVRVNEVDADRIAFDWVYQPNGSPRF